jgi:cyclase
VASGGGGTYQHLIDVFTKGKADAAIIASMIHTGKFTIKQIKDKLISANIPIRQKW